MLKFLLHQYMHYSIVSHFNQKIQQKTVNIIILVVLDIEFIEKKVVKVLGVYQNGQTVGFSFLFAKKFKATTQTA